MRNNNLNNHKAAATLYTALQQHAVQYPHGDPSLNAVQQEALQALTIDMPEASKEGDFNFYAKKFTATGKTRMYIKFVELMAQQYGRTPKTLFVSERKEGVSYVKSEFEKFAPHLVNDIGLFYSYAKELYNPIISTTYNSFLSGTRDGIFGADDVELIILDEIDLSLTEARLEAKDTYKNAVVIGASSTDQYSSDRHVQDHFRRFYSLDHVGAIDKNVIAPFRTILLPTEAYLEDIDIEAEDYNPRQLEKAINIQARNLAAINMYKDYVCGYTGKAFLGQQGFASCTSIQHAKDFSELGNKHINSLLPPGKIFSAPVWGEMPNALRKDTFEAYEAGEIMMLSNKDLLIRGYSYQPASIAFNLRPSTSSWIVGQRGGRVGRIDPNNPDKVSYMVDLVDQIDDPSKYPLLYGEYVGGAAFGTIFEEEPSFLSSETYNAREEPPEVGISVTSSIDEVTNFLKDRTETRDDRVRKGVINDSVLPSIRERMKHNEIETVTLLYKAIKDDLPSEEEIGPNDYVPTLTRFKRIVTGVTSGWDTRTLAPSHEAMALSNLFSCDVENLFGRAPNTIRKTLDSDLPYNPEQHQRFIHFLKKAGYSSMAQLATNCILSGGNTTQLASLSRGQKLPYSKIDGQFSDLVQEVATLINTSPEELFCFDPMDPDRKFINISNDDDYTGEQQYVEQIGYTDQYENTGDIMEEDDSVDLDQSIPIMWLEKERGKKTDFIRTEENFNPADQDFDHDYMVQEVRDTIKKALIPREQTVLIQRFWHELTLQESAEAFDVTGNRIRQIESKALRKLRHPANSEELSHFISDLACEKYAERRDERLKFLKGLVTKFETAVNEAFLLRGSEQKTNLHDVCEKFKISSEGVIFHTNSLNKGLEASKKIIDAYAQQPEMLKTVLERTI